jgi:hypothetical protein
MSSTNSLSRYPPHLRIGHLSLEKELNRADLVIGLLLRHEIASDEATRNRPKNNEIFVFRGHFSTYGACIGSLQPFVYTVGVIHMAARKSPKWHSIVHIA